MLHAEKAVIFHRSGLGRWERQAKMCIGYAETHGYRIVSVVHARADALALLRDDLVEVVIAALDTANDGTFLAEVEAAGGRVEYCRPPRYRLPSPPGIAEVAARMYVLGESAAEIMRLLGLTQEQLGEILSNLPVS